MYFAKTKRQMEEQEMKDTLRIWDPPDTLRAAQSQIHAKTLRADDISKGNRVGSKTDLRPEDLPDGAFVSPKHNPTQISPAQESGITVSREAQYLGSFSVSCSDEEARAQQVENQLQFLQSATEGKSVNILISLDSVTVCSAEDQGILMLHELKRISYATCIWDQGIFSFLARERHMNIQYCHTFATETPEQAEELNTIIGNAFRMAYAHQKDRHITFHQLIEAQVAEQQAQFREIEKQAQMELQRKLAEIARPTPFSQQAVNRMERRKLPFEDFEPLPDAGSNQSWARHAPDQVQHRVPNNESLVRESPTNPSLSRLSDPHPLPSSAHRRREGMGRDGGPLDQEHLMGIRGQARASPSLDEMVLPSPSTDSDRNTTASSPSPPPTTNQAIQVTLDSRREIKWKGSGWTSDDGEEGSVWSEEGEVEVVGERESPPPPTPPRCALNAVDSQMARLQQIRLANRPLPSLPSTPVISGKAPPVPSRSDQSHPSSFPSAPSAPPPSAAEHTCRAAVGQSPHRAAAKAGAECECCRGHRWKAMEAESEKPRWARTVCESEGPCHAEEEAGEWALSKQLEAMAYLDGSHIKDKSLRYAAWYQAGIPREIALEILQLEEVGSFIVRDSATHPSCYALSVRVPLCENLGPIAHYLIFKTQNGVKLKGVDREYPDLVSLVQYHSKHQLFIPCCLKLSNHARNLTFRRSEKPDAACHRMTETPSWSNQL